MQRKRKEKRSEVTEETAGHQNFRNMETIKITH